MRWGLVPNWSKDRTGGAKMINARSETVASKPAFKRAAGRRRCLVPANGYYEWQRDGGRKLAHFLSAPDERLIAMAGLYEIWRDDTLPDDDPAAWLWTCTVITRPATDALGHIHDRCPVLVPDGLRGRWLDCSSGDAATAAELLARDARAAPRAARGVAGGRQRQEQRPRVDRAGGRRTGRAGAVLMRFEIATPSGSAVVDLDRPRAAPKALLVLTHGAERRRRHRRPARHPQRRGARRHRRRPGAPAATGARRPARPAQDAAWLAAVAGIRRRRGLGAVPLVVGGRSNGARLACRTAVASGARAVVALAFPVHPPGKPETSRLDELDGAGVPVLVVQGDRDPFGMPHAAPRPRRSSSCRAADHSLRGDPNAVATHVRRPS